MRLRNPGSAQAALQGVERLKLLGSIHVVQSSSLWLAVESFVGRKRPRVRPGKY
jgi:hypothetical protein